MITYLEHVSIQQQLLSSQSPQGFALEQLLNELWNEHVGEASTKLQEKPPRSSQTVSDQRNVLFQDPFDPGNVLALVADSVHVAPSNLSLNRMEIGKPIGFQKGFFPPFF